MATLEGSLILLLLYTALHIQAGCGWSRVRSHSGYRLDGGLYSRARDEVDCISSCQRWSSQCAAVHFHPRDHYCIKTSYHLPTVYDAPGPYTLIVNMPVITALFVGTDEANLTFSGAVSQCQALQGRLMNQTHYMDLYNAGEDMCMCGWLAGGVAMYASQGGNYSWCVAPGPGTGYCTSSDVTYMYAWCVPDN